MKNKIIVLLNTIYMSFLKFTGKAFETNDRELQEVLESMSSNFERSNFENLYNGLNAVERGRVSKAVGLIKQVKSPNGEIKTYTQPADANTIHSLMVNSVGDLNLTIVRNTANITVDGNPVALPFVLFGAQDYTAGYASTLPSFLPAGITVSIAKDTLGNVVFTYVRLSDSATDTITVYNLGNVNYASFLAAQNQNYFTTCLMKFFLPNDSTIATQFSNPVLYGKLSALGMKNYNQLVPRSRILESQYLAYVLSVLMPEQNIVPDFAFVITCSGGAGYSIGLDMFMKRRGNLNELHG